MKIWTEGRSHFTHETECPWPWQFKHSHRWKRWSRSDFCCFTLYMLEGPTEWLCDCKMDVKSTWLPTRASNGSCFMVTWTIFNTHLLAVGLTQNRGETMALRTLTSVGLFHLSCVRMCMNKKSLEYHMVEGPVTYDFTLYLVEGPWSHYMIMEVHWDGLWTLSFGSHNSMVTTLGSCVKRLWGHVHPNQARELLLTITSTKVFGIIGQNSSVSKFNRWHAVIFLIFFYWLLSIFHE